MHGVIKEKICLQLLPTILVKPLSVGAQGAEPPGLSSRSKLHLNN